MTPFRTMLCWLLAALLVGLGMPLRGAPCAGADGDGAPGCCARTACCCDPAAGPEASKVCDCGAPKPAPAPLPSPSPKQPLQRSEPEPLAVPRFETPPAPQLAPVAALRRPQGLLPQRSRQEALSVWRC